MEAKERKVGRRMQSDAGRKKRMVVKERISGRRMQSKVGSQERNGSEREQRWKKDTK